MVKFRHPADRPVAVDANGETVTPDDSGVYEANVSESWLRAFADAYDADVSDMRVDDGGDVPPPETDYDAPEDASVADVIDRGICPWCDDYRGDAVAQHASSAHPDEWAAHKED